MSVTGGEECIFRGEPSIRFDYPCSSSLYRQLKQELTPENDVRRLLEMRQNELVENFQKYKIAGDDELEKLMFSQHHGVKTNLLDFTKDYLFALFFACSDLAEDGRVIVKRKGGFEKSVDWKHLWNHEGLLEPHEDLQRARDQHGIFLHIPAGRLPLKQGETVLIRSRHKKELSDLLKRMHNKSHETIFDDVYGEIDRRNRKDKKRILNVNQSRSGVTRSGQP